MNPFTQSTVARPVPGNHPDQRWNPRVADTHTDAADDLSPSGNDHKTQKGTRKGRPLRRAATLGLCLIMASASGLALKPAGIAGTVVVAGMLMPRHAQALDLNAASVQQLQTLNGIGPKTAAMIVDERMRGGDFASLTDLSDRVRGIGPKKAAALQAAGLKVGAGKPGTTIPAASASSSKAARR